MNRKILAFSTIAVLVLSIVLAIAPVMAQAEKATITIIQLPNAVQPSPTEDTNIFDTNGYIHHAFNVPTAGTAKLWINSAPPAAPTYTATTTSVNDINLNMKTGQGDSTAKVTYNLGTGTFEGVICGKISGPPFTMGLQYYEINYHGVLHGTGQFEGQTMMLDGVKALGQPLIYTGTILTP